jgi:hypothetical protein
VSNISPRIQSVTEFQLEKQFLEFSLVSDFFFVGHIFLVAGQMWPMASGFPPRVYNVFPVLPAPNTNLESLHLILEDCIKGLTSKKVNKRFIRKEEFFITSLNDDRCYISIEAARNSLAT